MNFIILIIGCALLWKSADIMIDGASAIAKRFKISDLIIGLTLVAFGTSAPELFVNAMAAIQGKSDIVFGNVIGSNIANLLLGFGVAGLLYTVALNQKILKRDAIFNVFSLLLFCIVILVFRVQQFSMTPLKSIVLLIAFGYFLFVTILKPTEKQSTTSLPTYSLLKACVLFSLGLALLPISSKLVVSAAISIAKICHISETFISLFAIAIGTSLPEIVTAVISVKKNQHNIAIGNILGSNIFNILLVIGTSGLIFPLALNKILIADIIFLNGINLLVLFYFLYSKKASISRLHSCMLLLMYVGYIAYTFCRG